MAMTKRLKRQYTNELINIEKHFDWNLIYEEVDTEEVIGKRK